MIRYNLILRIIALFIFSLVSSSAAQNNAVDVESLIEKADSLHRANQLDSAITVARQAVSTAETERGERDTLTASAILTLARIYATGAELSLAESLFTRALDIKTDFLGREHPDVAGILKNIGDLFRDQGKYPESEDYFLQAIAIYEQTGWTDKAIYATTLRNLAEVCHEQGKYDEAEIRYNQALELFKRTVGANHVETGQAFAALGRLYVDLGKFVEAEQYYLQARDVYEKVLDPDDPLLAKHLNNLGLLYHGQGRFEEARQNYQRALEIKEKAYGPNHPTVGISLGNLGRFHMDIHEYDKALSYFDRCRSIFENALGPDHPIMGTVANNLGLIHNDLGNYAEAEKYFRRSLEIKEQTFGKRHPKYAISLLNFGVFYFDTGEYPTAESILVETLDIFENSISPVYPDIEMVLKNLAKTYCAQGKLDLALDTYMKRQNFLIDLYRYVFAYASEDRKMSYVKRYPLLEGSLISLALQNDSPGISNAALDMVLKGKALVVDAISREKETAYCVLDQGIKDNLEKHAEVCGEISNLALSEAVNPDPAVIRDSLGVLYSLKDNLEIELSKSCSEFKDALDSRDFTTSDIATQLPEGTVLWDILRYIPYDFTRIGTEAGRQGSPRYMAFSLSSDGSIRNVDLGESRVIDSLISECHRALKKAPYDIYGGNEKEAEAELAAITDRLRDLVFTPLESMLNGESRIFISPDASLSLLPFEILPLPTGGYLVEKYSINYLSSGKDLLKYRTRKDYDRNNILIVTNPDYDLEMPALSRPGTERQDGIGYALSYQPSRGPSDNSECLSGKFDPLPGTYDEGIAVLNLFKGKSKFEAENYWGEDASEEFIKGRKEPPLVLHLATHGYFCPQSAFLESMEENINPLIYSGLVLAGANRALSQQAVSDQSDLPLEDGLLTSLEVSGMNFLGTELVVLSACQTGLGEVVSGEGVFGLRRAFQHAGVRSIVMSMWPVPDKETREIIQGFYKSWLSGYSKVEALRKSELDIISERREAGKSTHPFFWGGFILLGDPN